MCKMNRSLTALLSRLSYGDSELKKDKDTSFGFVETLAQVYERARNALEYRAENLVRRAAIERILKRRILINKNPKSLTENLLTELKWAKYLSYEEVKNAKKMDLEKILTKYTSYLKSKVPDEWIIKIASSEIEELFNLNTDYKQFTFFAFQALRQKVAIEDENSDLLVYFAVDKIYAGSDDEQIAYHILRLADGKPTIGTVEEAWRLFNLAKNHKELTRITKLVRRQMPPLILLRDIYFYDPTTFKETVRNEKKYCQIAGEVLDIQLEQMSGRIATAGFRSVLYVFLTKMIFAIVLEVPFEILFFGHLNKFPLALNLMFPPVLMWITTSQISLPKEKEKETLINRSWFILENFEALKEEDDVITAQSNKKEVGIIYSIFSLLYLLFFAAVFGIIIFVLKSIGYTLFSGAIFIFFLTIIAFFAYRISQIAKVYSWKNIGEEKSTFIDIISLPILATGSRLSKGLSKLNFLAFTFDFILEAPFKIILGFVDGWVHFLSIKKDREILE
jgi:hypothetical protein